MFFVIFLQSSYSHNKPLQKQACFYRRLIDWGRGYGVIGSPLYSFRDLSGTHHDGIVTMLILSLNVILTRNMLLQYEINIFFFYQQNLCDTWGIKNVLYDYGLYDLFVAPLLNLQHSLNDHVHLTCAQACPSFCFVYLLWDILFVSKLFWLGWNIVHWTFNLTILQWALIP